MAAIQKRREKAVKKALEAGKAEPRPTQMDLHAAIVGSGIKNTPDNPHSATKLIAHFEKELLPALHLRLQDPCSVVRVHQRRVELGVGG